MLATPGFSGTRGRPPERSTGAVTTRAGHFRARHCPAGTAPCPGPVLLSRPLTGLTPVTSRGRRATGTVSGFGHRPQGPGAQKSPTSSRLRPPLSGTSWCRPPHLPPPSYGRRSSPNVTTRPPRCAGPTCRRLRYPVQPERRRAQYIRPQYIRPQYIRPQYIRPQYIRPQYIRPQ